MVVPFAPAVYASVSSGGPATALPARTSAPRAATASPDLVVTVRGYALVRVPAARLIAGKEEPAGALRHRPARPHTTSAESAGGQRVRLQRVELDLRDRAT